MFLHTNLMEKFLGSWIGITAYDERSLSVEVDNLLRFDRTWRIDSIRGNPETRHPSCSSTTLRAKTRISSWGQLVLKPSFFHTPTISPAAPRPPSEHPVGVFGTHPCAKPSRCQDVHTPKLMPPIRIQLGYQQGWRETSRGREMGDAEKGAQGRSARDGQGHMARLAIQNPYSRLVV
ncbi:hypothetical protein Hypma_006992 [Hypsizygus marmoreus]|uniref:Uncharacterized protein n=1 Tax=Hypsizygus marmoreus TaxID=39966 RepID=A0A369KHI9_HYPMA|nr:hypothetical protein Hypma_006992 [Hypsizygus marmoreus]